MGKDHKDCKLKGRKNYPCQCVSSYQTQGDNHCVQCCIYILCSKNLRSKRRNHHHGDYTEQRQDDNDDNQHMNDICSQCNISIKFKKNQCSEIWPAKVGNWNENEIQKILNTYSGKESTTKNLIPETHTLTLVASLSTVLVLAIIFILFLILWISFRRKRNSTPDNNFASSNVQNVNENNHPYEEIDENVTTTSFCNYNILDKSTTTINTRNISEETYEDLTERSSPGYDKLVFNELHQVNNENRNNSYHVVEK